MSTAGGLTDSRRTPEAVRQLRLRKRELQHADPRRLLPRVGSTVDGFLLEERLGAGGFGTVFRARRGPHLYALKFLYLPRTGRWGRRELEVLLRIPLAGGLLSVEGHGYWPDDTPLFLYLVMPYVRGSRLFVWARRTRPCARQAAYLVLELARQLGTVHQAGVVHRDVKGDNVLVHALTGKPVLVDFGVGTYPGAPEMTGPRPPGTARYRSPESLRFRHQCKPEERYKASARDDLWALGVLLYVLLTGAYPFDVKAEDEEEEDTALEALILNTRPEPPHERNARVPRALSELNLRLLEKAPEARYASAEAVCEALEAVLEETRKDTAWEVPLVEGASADEVLEEAQEDPPLEAEPSESLSSEGELALQSLTDKEELPPPDAREPSPPAPPAPAPAASPASKRVLTVAWAGVALGLGALLGTLLLAPWQASLESPRAPTATEGDFSGQEVAPAWKPLEGGEGAVPPWAPTPAPVARATPPEEIPRVKTPQKKKGPGAALAKACATAAASTSLACTGAQVRSNPPPEDCPTTTVAIMEQQLGVAFNEEVPGQIEEVPGSSGHGPMREGPVTVQALLPVPGLELGTRFRGRLFIGPERVQVRLTEALTPGGELWPVCAVLHKIKSRPKRGDELSLGADTAIISRGGELSFVRRFE